MLTLLTHIVPPVGSTCSAPDYPQFMPEDTERYQNLAAVALLTGPDWSTPKMQQYAAAHPRCVRGTWGSRTGDARQHGMAVNVCLHSAQPCRTSTTCPRPCSARRRPEAQPYYELWVPDSDEEWEPAASDASGMTDVQRPTASVASDAATFQDDAQAAAATGGEIDSLQAGSTAAAAAAAAAAAEEDVSADTGVALEGAGASVPAPLKVRLPAPAAASGKQEHECSSPSRKRSRRQQSAADKDAASADTAVAVEVA